MSNLASPFPQGKFLLADLQKRKKDVVCLFCEFEYNYAL